MLKRILSLAVSAVMAVTLFSGCGAKQPVKEPNSATNSATEKVVSEDPTLIKIAVGLPVSGDLAKLGGALANGAQMSFDEKKAEIEKLGFKVKMELKDDAADAKVGTNIAHGLVADKNVLGVVGHFNSGLSIPTSEIYATDNLAMLSPGSTNVKVTDRELKNVNRICSRDDVQGPVAAQFAITDLVAKKAFVVHDQKDYGKGVAEQFKATYEKLGGEIVKVEAVDPKGEDFSAVVTQMTVTKPDVVFFGGEYPVGGKLIKQMRAKDVKAIFIGPDGVDDAEFVKIGGDAVVGAYYTSVCSELASNKNAVEWSKKFEEQFKSKPSNWAAYGYDAMSVMIEAIKNAVVANGNKKPTREQVSAAVRAIKGFKGLGSNVTFNKRGDNEEAGIFIYKFEKAEYPAPAVKSIQSKEYLKP